MIRTLIILLITLLPPLLAIYAMIMRSKNKKQGQVGFVYNGKIWVTWVCLIGLLGGLFMIFGLPLFIPDDYVPNWDQIITILWVIIEYISYVLVAYRPATAEEIEEAKASGQSAIKTTTSATTSMFSGILSCLGLSIASIPTLLYSALNPVLAIKVIHGVTYKVIDTSLFSIPGRFIINVILFVLITAVLLMFASTLAVLLGVFGLGVITIVKFFKNIKESKQTQLERK